LKRILKTKLEKSFRNSRNLDLDGIPSSSTLFKHVLKIKMIANKVSRGNGQTFSLNV